MTQGTTVEVERLTKRYGDGLALADVTVAIDPGSFLVLLGPSGSGKTTFIRCLAGIERPTAGLISIAGRRVADSRLLVAPERRELAMVFQDFALWPHMTALENVRFALRRRRIAAAEARRRAAGMLARVGLDHKRERYPHELSGGEQQRVALARALVGEPRLMLFDEPLSSLDAGLRERLRIEIATLVRESGATAVYITHDQSEAFALGDQVGVLQAGRLVQLGSPESVYRTPAHAFVARFTGLAGGFRGRVLAPVSRELGGGELRAPYASRRVTVALPSSDPGRRVDIEVSATVGLGAGAAVDVLVRPAGVRICEPGAHACALVGTVRDIAFCGRGYEYVVGLAPDHELVGVFDERRLRRGARCGIELDPGGCLAFPYDPAMGTPSELPASALPGAARALPAPPPAPPADPAGRPVFDRRALRVSS